MVEEMRFTATARRDGRWWVVQCDEHPGAISQVARLDQAAAHQREAIAFVAGLEEEEVEVEVHPILPDGIAGELEVARSQREQADQLQRSASQHWRSAARQLGAAGLSVRDIGTVLGVSYQRAHQLLEPHAEDPLRQVVAAG